MCHRYLLGPLQMAARSLRRGRKHLVQKRSPPAESRKRSDKPERSGSASAASRREVEPSRDRSVDRLGGLSEQQGAEFARVLDAHTAMALEPIVAIEQRLQRRVVQIDVETVRRLEFQPAERRAPDPAIAGSRHSAARPCGAAPSQFGSRASFGRISFVTIERGTYHGGLKSTLVIAVFNSGVCLSVSPTTTRVVKTGRLSRYKFETRGRDIDPDAVGRKLTREPAQAFQIDNDGAPLRLAVARSSGTARARRLGAIGPIGSQGALAAPDKPASAAPAPRSRPPGPGCRAPASAPRRCRSVPA